MTTGKRTKKPTAVKVAAPAKPARAGKKKAAAAPPARVPARRLTPEARTKLNERVAKGVSLSDALRQVGQWETFVAPVREPPPLAERMRGGGAGGGGGHHGPSERRPPAEDEEPPA